MTYEAVQRRSGERFRMCLEGRVVPYDSSSPIECTIWDISDTGARIAFQKPAEIPLQFELQIPTEDASAQVRLIWSNGREYGVAFMDNAPIEP
jgi:c-di-GMP-binding flagellar brake protein YcgR